MRNRINANAVRSLSPIQPYLKNGQQYRLLVKWDDVNDPLKKLLDLPENASESYSFLPPIVGKNSAKNAEGQEIVRKDLPKITMYRMIHTSWEDWHGQPHSGVKSQPYKVYPRDKIPPAGDLFFFVPFEGGRAIVSDLCTFTEKDAATNLRRLNLFLEFFGGCEIIDEKGKFLIAPKIRKLSWDLLPVGDYPWSRSKAILQKATATLPQNSRPVIEFRMKEISRYSPKQLAVGKLGFHGYFVFCFPSSNIYLLESIFLDNATYVFDSNWAKFSEYSKSEIIAGNHFKSRIIHDKNWQKNISKILGRRAI